MLARQLSKESVWACLNVTLSSKIKYALSFALYRDKNVDKNKLLFLFLRSSSKYTLAPSTGKLATLQRVHSRVIRMIENEINPPRSSDL